MAKYRFDKIQVELAAAEIARGNLPKHLDYLTGIAISHEVVARRNLLPAIQACHQNQTGWRVQGALLKLAKAHPHLGPDILPLSNDFNVRSVRAMFTRYLEFNLAGRYTPQEIPLLCAVITASNNGLMIGKYQQDHVPETEPSQILKHFRAGAEKLRIDFLGHVSASAQENTSFPLPARSMICVPC